jgi:hypothetical protein
MNSFEIFKNIEFTKIQLQIKVIKLNSKYFYQINNIF